MHSKLFIVIPACWISASAVFAAPAPGVAWAIFSDLGFERHDSGIRDVDGGRLSYSYPDLQFDRRSQPKPVNPRTFFRENPHTNTAPWKREVAKSGFPIGVDNWAICDGRGGSFSGQVPGFQSYIELHWEGHSYRRYGAARFSEPKNPEMFAKLEGALRWMSANAELRGATTQTVSISGHAYAGLRNLAGRLHVSARKFAQREGYEFIVNRNAGRFMLRNSQRAILFPLACNQMKVGDEWVAAEVMISAVEDEPYIPFAMIQSVNL